ncbi:hypothetical protein PINS_up009004 [Pythium insidiosum]|nr:hypothetical protein PINS_up009004 [Pythium insidiosum]
MGVDEYDDELEDELDDEGAAVAVAPKPRRRFVRSGMTSYEQWISRNAMGRRFSRRSGHDAASHGEPSPKEESEDPTGEATTCSPSSSSGSSAELSSPCDPAVETTAPVSLQRQTSATSTTSDSSRGTAVSGAPRSARGIAAVSSLSTALNEVLNSQPTALKSVVDRSATPKTVRAFVVEKTPDGNLFVASRRVPDMAPDVPLRPKDDSFLGEGRELPVLTVEAGATTSKDEFFGKDDHKAAAHLVRHSDMEFVYNNRPWTTHGRGPAPAPPSFAHDGPLSTRATTTSVQAASIAPSSAATLTIAAAAQVATGIRRRLSNSDRNAVPSVSPSSNNATRSSQRVIGSMAQKYMDHMRNRSNSNANRDEKLQYKQRSALPAPPSASHHDESLDKGPMTLDELLFASPPKQPSSLPPPPASRPVREREIITSDGEEDDDNMLMNSFLNVRDIDFMPRKKSTDAVEGLDEGHGAHISDEEEDFS